MLQLVQSNFQPWLLRLDRLAHRGLGVFPQLLERSCVKGVASLRVRIP